MVVRILFLMLDTPEWRTSFLLEVKEVDLKVVGNLLLPHQIAGKMQPHLVANVRVGEPVELISSVVNFMGTPMHPAVYPTSPSKILPMTSPVSSP